MWQSVELLIEQGTCMLVACSTVMITIPPTGSSQLSVKAVTCEHVDRIHFDGEAGGQILSGPLVGCGLLIWQTLVWNAVGLQVLWLLRPTSW